MLLFEIIAVALNSLKTNKLRSSLTVLGIEVYVDGLKLRIIGILDSKDKGMFGRNEGNNAFVPITRTLAVIQM